MTTAFYPDGNQQNISARVSGRRLSELAPDGGSLSLRRPLPCGAARVHILALGDVGASLLLGLKVLGGGVIDTIGIFDVNEKVCRRYEMEMNQIGWAFEEQEDEPKLPAVEIVTEENLFDCDMFLFCASKAVPAIGASGDVRMVQFEANRTIVEHYARMAAERNYEGIFAVVSDPVDPLCSAAWKAAAGKLRNLLSLYNANSDLISIGAYKHGTNPALDEAIRKIDGINAFLMQAVDESYSFDEVVEELMKAVSD